MVKITHIKLYQGEGPEQIKHFKDEHNIVYTQEQLADLILSNPNAFCVGIKPYPILKSVFNSITQKKYIRSSADDTSRDNLLELPNFE